MTTRNIQDLFEDLWKLGRLENKSDSSLAGCWAVAALRERERKKGECLKFLSFLSLVFK